MSDTVVLSENILDIALWVKNPRWPPLVQGQAINSYHFLCKHILLTIEAVQKCN